MAEEKTTVDAGQEFAEASTEQETAETCEAAEDAQEEDIVEDIIEDTDEAAAEKNEKEKKNLFKKKEKKKDKRDEKIEELTDQLKRQMAEFENFRRRSEQEKNQMYEIGAKSIIEKILPVVDNFERGLSAVPEELKTDAFVDGMDKIYKQMMSVFAELDVKPIEAVGKEFDHEYHNAVMQVESEEYESGVVAQELLKGYTYRDSVVRHSMVAVVQ